MTLTITGLAVWQTLWTAFWSGFYHRTWNSSASTRPIPRYLSPRKSKVGREKRLVKLRITVLPRFSRNRQRKMKASINLRCIASDISLPSLLVNSAIFLMKIEAQIKTEVSHSPADSNTTSANLDIVSRLLLHSPHPSFRSTWKY